MSEEMIIGSNVEVQTQDALSLMLPLKVELKRKREVEDDHEVTKEVTKEVESEVSNIQIFKSVNDVLKPCKFESDFVLKRRVENEKIVVATKAARQKASGKRNLIWSLRKEEEERKEKRIVLANKKREYKAKSLRGFNYKSLYSM